MGPVALHHLDVFHSRVEPTCPVCQQLIKFSTGGGCQMEQCRHQIHKPCNNQLLANNPGNESRCSSCRVVVVGITPLSRRFSITRQNAEAQRGQTPARGKEKRTREEEDGDGNAANQIAQANSSSNKRNRI